MIFQPELIEKILAGEKTVTRRPVKYGYTDGAVRPKRVSLPCKYRVGRDYALQGPGEKGSKARARTIPGYRLLIKGVREECLHRIAGDGEAELEGFESALDFVAYWHRLYGRRSDPFEIVRRIEFELLQDEGEGTNGENRVKSS